MGVTDLPPLPPAQATGSTFPAETQFLYLWYGAVVIKGMHTRVALPWANRAVLLTGRRGRVSILVFEELGSIISAPQTIL